MEPISESEAEAAVTALRTMEKSGNAIQLTCSLYVVSDHCRRAGTLFDTEDD